MKATRRFNHVAESVAAARRFAAEILRDADPEVLSAVRLMVSELATNCIRHTGDHFELTIIATPEEIRVQATDLEAGQPRLRVPKPTDLSGRGLQIIDTLATSWGYEPLGSGKRVWFTLMVADRPPHDGR